MGTKWRNVVIWTKNFLRQLLIIALLFLTLWNCSKVPYYIGFDANGDTSYEKGGLTGSINLYNWVKGFQSSKLHSPACNFLLVHIAFGSPVLIMMALSLINSTWRKKYGIYYFTFTILLGAHTIPAAWTMNAAFTKYLFTFTCLMVITAALFGFYTLKNYDNNPTLSEKSLLIEYSIITLGAYGAGFAESFGVTSKFLHKMKNGVYRDYGSTPDPLFGHSMYDLIPETFGLAFFFVFTAIVWFWWPIKLLQDDADETTVGTVEEDETAHLLSDKS